MIRRVHAAGIVGLLLGCAASAQSFNIDLNIPAPGSLPAASFGGGANQPGVWNGVNIGVAGTVSLVDLSGNATGVTLTRISGGVSGSVSLPTLTGEHARLLNDFERTSAGDAAQVWQFSNVPQGTYALYTYAMDPQQSGRATAVQITGNGATVQYVGGNPGGSWAAPTQTYAMHVVSLQGVGSISVSALAGTLDGQCGVAGFQLRKLTGAGERIRWYVDKGVNAAGVCDGNSWATALPDLQFALRGAALHGGNVEVWVRKGIYYPTGGTDRTVSFKVPTNLRLYGGFAGTEATLAERTAARVNVTYLSGNIGNTGSSADNSFTVVDAKNTTFSTLVDGFFITSGNASGTGGNDGRGAGIRMDGGLAVFRTCNIINNMATVAGAGAHSQGGAPTFVDCVFFNNDCTNGEGGAIYNNNVGSLLDVWNCQFLGNRSGGPGGAILCAGAPSRVVNCLFSGNYSLTGGGAIYATGATANVLVHSSTFSRNASGQSVGGMYIRNGADLTMHSTILWGNLDANSTTVEQKQLSMDSLGSGSTYTMTYSTVQGLQIFNGVGCNGTDPQFVNALGADGVAGNFDDNLRLRNDSTMINAGNTPVIPFDTFDVDGNGVTNEILPIDLDRKPRRQLAASHPVTGVGPAPCVDRGAYEFVAQCAGDTNGDNVVNFADLNNVLSGFGQSGVGLPGDVNGDGVVNFTDLNIVLSNFGQSC